MSEPRHAASRHEQVYRLAKVRAYPWASIGKGRCPVSWRRFDLICSNGYNASDICILHCWVSLSYSIGTSIHFDWRFLATYDKWKLFRSFRMRNFETLGTIFFLSLRTLDKIWTLVRHANYNLSSEYSIRNEIGWNERTEDASGQWIRGAGQKRHSELLKNARAWELLWQRDISPDCLFGHAACGWLVADG